MTDIYAQIISFDWERALLAYDLNAPGFVEAEIRETGKTVKSVEACGTGRLVLENLPAGTFLHVTFRHPGGEKELVFTALPPPEGEMTGQFALIADPHISTKDENRKGRFFIESASLVRDALERCAGLGIACTLWPGDITNAGLPGEYALAAKVLKALPTPPLLVPGNHDHDPGAWKSTFGPRRGVYPLPGGGSVVAVDTSDQLLHEDDAKVLRDVLRRDGKVTVMTHYQFFPSSDITHVPPEKTMPLNIADHAALLEEICRTPSVVWAGHQNILSVTRAGRAVQINLPQIPQYSCGWLRVRRFSNGDYYTFEPVSSEVLRQWSRKAGEEAASFYGEPQWRGAYRCGKFPQSGNFFIGREA
ncbi:MAG: metallophosphoesterase [Lentisphaeria bacterium]|nr:metallophosphoesterase [Lentisphaeria bacterium]